MKNLMLLFLIIPCIATTSQNIDSISKALSRGDVESLSTYFDESVEIDDDFYDKNEAKAEVKKFFSKNPPKSFSLIHKGTSKGENSKYFMNRYCSWLETIVLMNSNLIGWYRVYSGSDKLDLDFNARFIAIVQYEEHAKELIRKYGGLDYYEQIL